MEETSRSLVTLGKLLNSPIRWKNLLTVKQLVLYLINAASVESKTIKILGSSLCSLA